MLRRRRIFRMSGTPTRSRVWRRLFVALAGLAVAGVIAVGGLPSDLLLRTPPADTPGQITAGPSAVRVVDGDTLRVGETRVRLLGLDAPERGQTCRRADGTEFDCGAAATDMLAGLLRDQRVRCRLHGNDRYGRALAVCEAGGRELNSALVTAGFAVARDELPPLKVLEAEARAARRGLWATAFDRPDVWRRSQ